jgi:cell shape-determining protein MreC
MHHIFGLIWLKLFAALADIRNMVYSCTRGAALIMSKIDFVFIVLGLYCYFSTMSKLKDQSQKLRQYEDLQKKKKQFADYKLELKRRENMAKLAEERKRKRNVDFQKMASTVEMLSNLSDQEVMRQSHITSGKY